MILNRINHSNLRRSGSLEKREKDLAFVLNFIYWFSQVLQHLNITHQYLPITTFLNPFS